MKNKASTSAQKRSTINKNVDLAAKKYKIDDDPSTYDASGLKTSLHGTIYQLKLLILFAMRGHKEGYDFRLATEMNAAEKFDDVVLKYKESTDPNGQWIYRFLQAKHKQNSEKKITANDLKTTSDTSNDFALSKYFVSFCKIKDRNLFKGADLKDFVIITNTEFDFSERESKYIKHNNLAREWKGYFIEENYLKNDKILYFEKADDDNKIQAKMFRLKESKTISEMFKSSMINEALKTTEIEFRTEIANKLNAIQMLNSSTSEKEKKSWEMKMKKYGNSNTTEYKALENDKRKLCDEKDLRVLKNQIHETKDLEKLKQKIETILKDRIKTSTLNRIQKDNNDLEEAKRDLHKILDDVISDISIIKLALNDDLDEYTKEFIQKFRFVTNYPSETDLSELLKNELSDGFKLLNADLVNASFEEEMLNFLKSYDHGMAKFYSGQNAIDLFNGIKFKINSLISVGLSIAYPEKLKVISELDGINFQKNISELETFLSNEKQQIFHLSTQSTRLSALKVYQTLKNSTKFIENVNNFEKNKNPEQKHQCYIFMPLKKLLREETQEYVLSIFGMKKTAEQKLSYELLVIECQNRNRDKNKEIRLFTKLATIFDDNKLKKLILIAQNEDNLAENFQNYFENKYVCVFDQTSFGDLNNETQENLLRRKINFQGEDNCLNNFVDKNSVVHFDIIDSKSLAMLFENEQISIGNRNAFSSIGYVDDFYIERTFHSLSEDDFIRLEDKVTIIADECGVGKSTVLVSLAKKMEKLNKNDWIVCVNLLDYVNIGNGVSHCLNDFNFEDDDTVEATGQLSKMIIPENEANYELERKLFEVGLRRMENSNENELKKPQIVLQFDAVDEISPTHKSTVIKLFKTLTRSGVKRIIITTRIHMKDDLEANLQLSTFNLDPLTSDDQKSFLSNFLKWHFKYCRDPRTGRVGERTYESILETLDEVKALELSKYISSVKEKHPPEQLKQVIDEFDFSEYAGNLVDQWIETVKYSHIDFLHVPLHLAMLIDVIVKNGFQLREDIELFDIYKEFINAKFDIKFDDKERIQRGNPSAETSMDINTSISRDIHCELAVKLLIEKYENMLLPHLNKLNKCQNSLSYGKNAKEEFTRYGLLILKRDQLDFVHRSFAEYFLNEYLLNNLNNEEVQKVLFGKIFQEDIFLSTRQFFDSYLKNDTKTLDFELTRGAKQLLMKELQMNHSEKLLLHEFACDDLHKIIRFFLNVMQKYFRENQDSLVILEKYILAIDKNHECNILYELVGRKATDITMDLLNWIKNYLGMDTFQMLIQNCNLMNNNEGMDTILHRAVGFRIEINDIMEMIDPILHMVDENNQTHSTSVIRTTSSLWKWFNQTICIDVEKELAVNKKIKNTKVIESKLQKILTFRYGDIETIKMIESLLNYIKVNISDEEYIKEIVLANDNTNGRNILFYSIKFLHGELSIFLLNWVKDNLGIEALKNFILKAEIVRNTVKETILYKVISMKNNEILKLMLDFVAKNVKEKEFIKELILFNDKEKGENILFHSLDYGTVEITEYLLNWVIQNLGINIFKEFLIKRNADNNRIDEIAFHKAMRCQCRKSYEKTQLILNILNIHVTDKVFLKNLISSNYSKHGENIIDYSLHYPNVTLFSYLIEWVKNCLGLHILKEFILNGIINEEATTLHGAIFGTKRKEIVEIF